MEYIAHKRTDGTEQPLKEHLNSVAEMAGEFASFFNAQEHARRIGLLHDAGKYGKTSQHHMQDPEHTAKCDHSTAGAQKARDYRDMVAAMVVAGHHAGLPDMGSRASMPGDGTLMGRLNQKMEPIDAWNQEIKDIPEGDLTPSWLRQKAPLAGYTTSQYTRMLFSCLVDADFLDTEAFMSENSVKRGEGETIESLNERFLSGIARRFQAADGERHADNELNQIRDRLLHISLKGDELPPGMYSMTIRTGGGKTTDSLAFALSHAVKYRKRRIIYVIPYTSIIEQNAGVFRELLGSVNVLEHHSNVDLDSMNQEDLSRWSLASENWDAPLVVTTAVQFFESLFSSRPSRCRKLHNIADSVIILDEAQMMPLQELRPCVAALVELVQHYGVTAVLCTATQPALESVIHEFDPSMTVKEIIPSELSNHSVFRRTTLQWSGEKTMDEIVHDMCTEKQGLCIVNLRKTALELYRQLPPEDAFYLTTWMTARHRTKVIQEIKKRLNNHEECRVISTSLIECGVDVDFPRVWREEAGLDSILQAAGRCNREGKRKQSESVVSVFSLEGCEAKHVSMQLGALHLTQEKYPQTMDSNEAICYYFQQLRNYMGKERLDGREILQMSNEGKLRTIGEKFHLIDDNTIPLYIDQGENHDAIETLSWGIVTKEILRKLSRFSVNLYPYQVKNLLGQAKEDILPGGYQVMRGASIDVYNGQFAILTNQSLYLEETGLQEEWDGGIGIFL